MGWENFLKATANLNVKIGQMIKIEESVYKTELGNTKDKEAVMQNKYKLREIKKEYR